MKVRPEPAWIILENAAALCHGVLEVGERREASDDPRHTPWLASATHGASVYRRFRPPGIPSDSIARKPYHMLHDHREHRRRRFLTLRQRKALGDLFLGLYGS